MGLKTGKYFIFFHSPGSALIHPLHGILVTSMKTFIQIMLLALLVGCASPYYPVYVNNEGDYYIAERTTNESYYYGAGSYPWWISGYPPQTFVYYSPYFYPHYFSVWYPPAYRPYYGLYGGYYGYWCPPYRYNRRHRYPGDGGIVVSPVLPPAMDNGQVVAFPGSPVNRDLVNRRRKGKIIAAPVNSASTYPRTSAQSSVSAPRMSASSSARFSPSSSHTGSAGRGKASSSRLSSRHRQ